MELRALSRGSLLALGLAIAAPGVLRPQSVLAPGARVRVTAPTLVLAGYRGTVRNLSRDSLTVDSLTIPLAAVTRLEVGSYRTMGMLVGAGVGFAASQIAGRLAGLDPSSSDDWFFYPLIVLPGTAAGAAIGASPKYATIYAAVGALAGGLLGAGIGAAVYQEDQDIDRVFYAAVLAGVGAPIGLALGAVTGGLTHLTHWRPIPTDRLRLSVTPGRAGGVIVGAAVFR